MTHILEQTENSINSHVTPTDSSGLKFKLTCSHFRLAQFKEQTASDLVQITASFHIGPNTTLQTQTSVCII